MKFHHIGIATDNIEKQIEFIKKVFQIKHIGEIVFDEKQNASLCMAETEDGFQIEFISGETVSGFIKKRQYLYHTCYETENIIKCMEDLKKEGAVVISEEKEAVLFGGKKVAFLFSPLGIIELLER